MSWILAYAITDEMLYYSEIKGDLIYARIA